MQVASPPAMKDKRQKPARLSAVGASTGGFLEEQSRCEKGTVFATERGRKVSTHMES